MKVKVDESLCSGCGDCEETCPEVFHIEEDIARVGVDTVLTEAEDKCREALENCPSDAISSEE